MPTAIEQTLAIINSPDSKLRDLTPIIYRLKNNQPAGCLLYTSDAADEP